MRFLRYACLGMVSLTLVTAVVAGGVEEDAKLGLTAAFMHGTAADNGSIGAISYLLAVNKDNWKQSPGFRLGFSVGAMRRASSFSPATGLSDLEKELVNAAFTIFSGEALAMKIQLRLSDAQMRQLFGARVCDEISGPRPFAIR